MNTLADAWDWYTATRKNLERMQRLGEKHWDELPWATGAIGRDDDFRMLEAADIEKETKASLKPIDDLAVVVLFSVFESLVRDYVVAKIAPEAEGLSNPILKHAAEDAIRGVEEGSFYRGVLEPLKKQGRVPADLITQIDQVRDYRNWVAHGRRETPTNNVTPQMAFDRLKEFLDALEIAVAPEIVPPDPTPGEQQ
jgi:uncharacterized protein YutE (UPF0331/DUF86 family)